MRTPDPTPIPPMPPAPFEDGELIPPVDVFPEPLPLDPMPLARELAATGAGDDLAAWLIFALGLMLAGWMVWASRKFRGDGS